jgi:UTP--glucose-1-phosphate uridylyltransferase
MCEQVSNTSNVRADQKILQHMMNTGKDFLMEVTNKTKGDVKVNLACVVWST